MLRNIFRNLKFQIGPEPCQKFPQTSEIMRFAKIASTFELLTIVTNFSIIDVSAVLDTVLKPNSRQNSFETLIGESV